jgi:hypothetical protein
MSLSFSVRDSEPVLFANRNEKEAYEIQRLKKNDSSSSRKKEKRKKNDADVSKNAQGFEDDDYD